jgi:hypothetical protein
MPENINEWLKSSPPLVKELDNKAQYIPIGQIENDLDEYTGCNWGTSDFLFQIVKTGSYWFADASVMLETPGRPPMIGAVTFPINNRDDNMDYSGTALSFCIANAAKKLGIRFGRALNGRLDKGETSVPIVQIKSDFDAPDEKTDTEFEELKKKLAEFEFYEDAKEHLDGTTFKHTMEAKIIVNNKKRKS